MRWAKRAMPFNPPPSQGPALGRAPRRLRPGVAVFVLAAASLVAVSAAGVAVALLVKTDAPKPRRPSASPHIYYLAPSGSDAGQCASAQAPCASFNRAYRVAWPGDTVVLAGGDYPGQTIEGDGAKTAKADVLFKPAPGAQVRVAGPIYVYGSHLTLQGLQVSEVTIANNDQTPGRPNPTDVSLHGIV